MFTRGLKESVEFTCGRTFSVKFDKRADIEKIRAELSKTFIENKEVSSIELKTVSNEFNVEITTNYKLKEDVATEEVKAKMLESLKVLEPSMVKQSSWGSEQSVPRFPVNCGNHHSSR